MGRAITNEHRERSRFVRRMQPTSGVTLQRNHIYLKWKYAAGRQGNVPWERAQAVAATNVAIHNERFVARLEFLLRVSMVSVILQFRFCKTPIGVGNFSEFAEIAMRVKLRTRNEGGGAEGTYENLDRGIGVLDRDQNVTG